jgi:hypothetical protein
VIPEFRWSLTIGHHGKQVLLKGTRQGLHSKRGQGSTMLVTEILEHDPDALQVSPHNFSSDLDMLLQNGLNSTLK